MFWEDVTSARNSSTQAVVILMNDTLLYVKMYLDLSHHYQYVEKQLYVRSRFNKERAPFQRIMNYLCLGGNREERQVAIENISRVLPPFSDLEKHFFSLSIVTRIFIFLFVCLVGRFVLFSKPGSCRRWFLCYLSIGSVNGEEHILFFIVKLCSLL